jgi:DNA-binding GntR family transcriptional regulator
VGEHSVAFSTKQDWVGEIIRERIIVGAYRRGQQLKQADLAEELGVSITPVREALLTLEAEGYVRGLPHKGLLVPELVPELSQEIYHLRLILERDLTARALELITPAGLTELLDLQRNIVRALASDDLQSVRTANYRFHFRLYEIANRPQTLQFVRVLWAKYPFTAQDVKRGRPGRMRQEHDLFLKKVQQGDRDGAIEAMLQHIANGWRQVSDILPPAQTHKPKAPSRRLVASS